MFEVLPERRLWGTIKDSAIKFSENTRLLSEKAKRTTKLDNRGKKIQSRRKEEKIVNRLKRIKFLFNRLQIFFLLQILPMLTMFTPKSGTLEETRTPNHTLRRRML